MNGIRNSFVAAAIALVGIAQAADVEVDKDKGIVTVKCKIAPRKLPNLSEVYPIEVVAAWGSPKGKKAHETVVVIDANPSEVHKALESLGLKAGKPARGDDAVSEGPEVKVFLDVPGEGGETKRVPIEKCLVDRKTGKSLPPLKWRFTGSVLSQPDPTKEEKAFGADLTGTLIAVYPVTDETVLQSSLTMAEEKLVKLDTNKKLLPAEGTAVVLVLQAK